MERTEKQAILRAMIETEKNVSALYKLYAERFPEDRVFWTTISREEEEHAAMLGSAAFHLAMDRLPEGILIDKLPELQVTNKSIRKVTEDYAREIPSKKEAYNYAIQMEKSLSEAFMQELLRMKDAPSLVAMWQRLGVETTGHSERIRALLEA